MPPTIRIPWRSLAILAAGAFLAAAPAFAFQPTPHHAFYTMTLESARPSSGVVGAEGKLEYKWADVCDGWTVEQRYKLVMQYDQDAPVTIESDFVTWESKDGKTYRFNEKETRNGQVDADLRGDATLAGPGLNGVAHFRLPTKKTFILPVGSYFPTAHTLTLIHQAEAGTRFFAAHVFDGSTFDGDSTVSAVISAQTPPDKMPVSDVSSPLIARPMWQTWLGFYSDATKDADADYNLGMRLYDNGVSGDMTLDYGDYVVTAKLRSIEPLPKPAC